MNIELSFVGDILISRRLPEQLPKRFEEISKLIKKSDVRFGNL